MRSGSSRYERWPWSKICTWPGQFIGFSDRVSPSTVSQTNILGRYLSQWPEASQNFRSRTCGVFTST